MPVSPHEQVGYEFRRWRTTVDKKRQERFHRAALIDTTLFRKKVDVSVLANDCLHGARPRNSLGAKRLHVGVRVRQIRPIELGEELLVAATVASLQSVRRGRYIVVGFRFCGMDGSVLVEMEHKSLILDAQLQPAKSNLSRKLEPNETFEFIRRVELSPEMVSGYSFEFPHLRAHHDPVAAAAIGMRAPIAQGLMGLGLLFQEKVRSGLAPSFEIEAQFERPIFWDDILTLESAQFREFRAKNGQGKTVSRLTIHDWN